MKQEDCSLFAELVCGRPAFGASQNLSASAGRYTRTDTRTPAGVTARRLEELLGHSRMHLSIEASEGRVAVNRQPVFENTVELQKWVHSGTMDFLKILAGHGQLSKAKMKVGEGIDKQTPSYGRQWSPEEPESRRTLALPIAEGLRPRGMHTGTYAVH